MILNDERFSFYNTVALLVTDILPTIKNWRVLEKFISTWQYLYKYYGTIQLMETWIPLILGIMNEVRTIHSSHVLIR
jgi:hypothetical protein